MYSRYWLTSDLDIEQVFVKGIFYYPDGSEGVAGRVVSSGALTSSPASLTVSAKNGQSVTFTDGGASTLAIPAMEPGDKQTFLI